MWDDLEFKESIKQLQKAGPSGHTLAHITPEEGLLLKAFGGSGRINPNTKLPQYDNADNGVEDSYRGPRTADRGDEFGSSGNEGMYEPSQTTTNPHSENIGFSNPDPYSGDVSTGSYGGDYEGDNYGTGQYHGGYEGQDLNNYPQNNPNPYQGSDGPWQPAGPTPEQIAAQEEAERLAREGRITSGKEELSKTLKGEFDALDFGDGEAAFLAAFSDDLEEDYGAAQTGLYESFLSGGDYSTFNTPGQSLEEQQSALTDFRDTELENLATMAKNYGTHASAEAREWMGQNQANINALNDESFMNPDGSYNFDFSDFEFSTDYSKPEDVYDPEFFKEYGKDYKDPEGVYFGEGEDDPEDRSGLYKGDNNTIKGNFNPNTGLQMGTTVAQKPPPKLKTRPGGENW